MGGVKLPDCGWISIEMVSFWLDPKGRKNQANVFSFDSTNISFRGRIRNSSPKIWGFRQLILPVLQSRGGITKRKYEGNLSHFQFRGFGRLILLTPDFNPGILNRWISQQYERFELYRLTQVRCLSQHEHSNTCSGGVHHQKSCRETLTHDKKQKPHKLAFAGLPW